jgi:hypothetical protein
MNKFDVAILFLWLLLLIRNNAALLPLFVHCVFILCFSLFGSNFPIFCITSIALFQAAKININISSDLRYALWLLGCIYLLGAIDDLLYYHAISYQGFYFSIMPYIIIAIDAYIAAVIFKDGGRDIDGIIDRIRAVARRCLYRFHGI